MNRVFRLTGLAVLLLFGATRVAAALPIPDPPSFTSHSYILIDQHSRQVLAASNPDKHIPPASITKLMTVYIVFSEIKRGKLALDDKVNISEKAWRTGGSKMFVEVGDKVPVELLLHGVITSSGNDATVALAQHVAGTAQAFTTYMNQFAAKLGLKNSHFVDVDGLPAPKHYMSARDMATLAGDLIRDFPGLYKKFFSEKEFTYSDIKQYNRNGLLWTDPSVDGLKTGHTKAAGYCLVASAKRDGMRLVSVVTGSPSTTARKSDNEALLNYGFRFYQTYKLFNAGQPVTKVRVWKGAQKTLPVGARGAVYVTAARGARDGLKTSAELPRQIVAPITKGQRLGTLKIAYKGKPLDQVPLYATQAVPTGGIFRRLTDDVLLMFQ